MHVDAVRRELREGDTPSLRRRRWIAGLSAIGLVDFAIISLYQLGVIRRLPDLPGRIFDSNRVNASRAAYRMGVPDGTTGALLYAANMVLAGVGGSRRTGRHPAWDVALGAAVAASAAGAAQYLWEMGKRQQKACPYCIVGAALNFTMLPLALRQARRSLQTWREPVGGSGRLRRTLRR